ncbi:MAG: TonB-dependent receptor [Acidobacteria bacterium]|nr:TonB-dependent receptor [Acidobacteriota bacterium]
MSDPTGGAIVNAQVRMVNVATGEERTASTDESGRYAVSQLAPGKYELSVTASGFKRFVASGIELVTNQSAQYDAHLNVGEASQSVEVTASVLGVDTQTANKNITFSTKDMVELPQLLRSPLLFVHATAGVNAVRQGMQPYMTDQNTNRFALNGGRDESSAVLVDGIPITAPGWGGAIAVPSQDAVSETQVVRQAYDAQYGKTDGGAVTVVTKGGSNEFHGSVFEFLRNDHMDANSWANNKFGTGKTTFQRNQFGGNFGGPILKSRKLYFFSAFEGLAQGVPQNFTGTVPTAAMKQGDFSQVKNSDGSLSLIYDPASTTLGADGSYRRTQFPGNKIPVSRFDAVGKNVVNLYPDPNQSASLSNAGYFSKAGKYTSNYYKIDERVDWVKSEKYSLWGRLTQAWQTDSIPVYMGNGADSSTGERDPRFLISLGNTFVPSPTWVVNVLVGVGRWHEDDTTASSGYSGTIGLPSSLVSRFQADTLPQFNFNNYSQIGYTEHNQTVREIGNLQVNASKELHSHSLKFGGLFEVGRLMTNDAYSATFGFDSGMTSGPVAQTSSDSSGNDIASLLLGTGNGGSSPYNAQLALSQHYWAYYFNDTWKVTPKLTFTYGVRYEYQAPRTERFNRLTYFDFNAASPVSQASGVPAKGGLVYGHGQMWNPDYKNFAPRGSIAYRINEKLVFRAGYGIFFQPTVAVANGATDGFSTSTNWIASQGGAGILPGNPLSNPFPNGLNLPTGGAAGLATEIGQTVNATSLLHPTGYVQTYSADFQYQTGQNGMLELGYTGVQGRKLLLGSAVMNINQLNSKYLSMGTALNTLVSNPFYGVITDPTSVLSGKTVPQWRLLVPYPQYSAVMLSPDTPGSSSSFNALIVKYQQRFKAGLSVLATYQFSKAIDDVSETQVWEIKNYTRDINNLAAERSVSGHDVPRDFRMTALWELPVGRGKAYGTNMNKVADAIVGGWRVSTIVRLADGLPLMFSSTNSNGTYGYVVQRANITSLTDLGNVQGGQSPDMWFNKTAVSRPAAFTIGTAPRYTPNIRTGALDCTDLLLSKQWVAMERYRVQFRAEAYNFTNTPQYGRANTSAQSSALGTITGTTNVGPRNIQMGLRVDF